jgi:hypothetical protein
MKKIDGWPVRRIKLMELIVRIAEIGAPAKLIAIVWLACVRQGEALEMSVAETMRRCGTGSRRHTGEHIDTLGDVLGKRGWLKIERRTTHARGKMPLLIRWPILGLPEKIAEQHQQLFYPHEPEPAHGGVPHEPESAHARAENGSSLVPISAHHLTGTGDGEYRAPHLDQKRMRDANDSSIAGALWRRRARKAAGG